MTQDEFVEKYCKLDHVQKNAIEKFISSFQTVQTYRPQDDAALEKDDCILSTGQLLPLEDYFHQKDNR